MRNSFADQIAPSVIKECVNTGVFPSVVIAQAIEESGSGTSKLARMFNNLFGHIASGSWSGRTGQTVKGGKLWRAYDSVVDSISEHINVLKSMRYKLAGVFTAKNPFEQLLKIQKAGYNTGPDRDKYALKLANIIKAFNLQQYDAQMIAIERSKNPNNLAYSEQGTITRNLHNIIG